MEECVRMMQHSLRAAPSIKKRAKSVYQQRNLGTIKNRKKEKKQEKEKDVSNGETILRILRMRCVSRVFLHSRRSPSDTDTFRYRPGTSDFITQQMHAMSSLQAERDAQSQEQEKRKLQRPRQQAQPPPVPEIPAVPPLPSK